MLFIRTILLCSLLFCQLAVDAQSIQQDYSQYSNQRSKILTNLSDTVILDTLSIFPNSFLVRDLKTDGIIPKENYELIYTSGKLIFKSGYKPDSILVTYRSFPINLANSVQHKNPVLIKKGDSLFYERFYYQPKVEQSASFLDFGGLNYSGNFARGIQFGSNQDLTLSSNLDLRLNGKIGNDIEITAALTDNNIPLQPDGTTQQLQDFDKVYIQLKKDPHTIIAGDYSVKSFDSYFMRFSKQLQGASYANNLKFRNGMRLQTSTSLAVSRGKFARNVFQGSEGNQGPYRLIGNNNETFITVLAGSEKVFVDGVRLQRGEVLDYIMDYNTGELIFMPKFLITKDSRITVEFEYTDRNYFRTTVHEAINYKWKKLSVFTQLYSEQDAKNKPINNTLSDSTKDYLSNIGNDISNAYISGVNEVYLYDPNNIQYRLTDSTVNSVIYDSVFVYETNPDSAKYVLNFSYLGPNKGNYVTSQNSNNVRVYKWVAPVSGIPQGTYEPLILLVTPKSQLLFTFGTAYQFDAKTKVQAEMGFSNYDKNLFSSQGKEENKGYAANVQLNRYDSLPRNLIFTNTVNYEFKSDNFRQVEPYRNVEFARDWNISPQSNLTEHIARYQTGLIDTKHNITAGYKFASFIREKKYKGFENWLSFGTNYKNIIINSDARILTTQDTLNKSVFLRPSLNAVYSVSKIHGLSFGAGYFQENNVFKNKSTNVLQSNSFRNNNVSFQFFLPDSAKWNFILEYKFRNDLQVKNAAFKDSTIAHTVDFRGGASQLKNQNFNWIFTYRNLLVKDTTIQQKPEQTFLGRTEYGARIKKGFLRLNFIYELGGGREKIRQYTYVEVPAGQGFYKWIDQNQNGIKELNEFVQSQFVDSAQFVRVQTDLNAYLPTNSTAYTQNITIQPKALWFNENGFKKFVSKITLLSYLQTRRKTYKNGIGKMFNPFIFNTTDTTTITLNSSLRNSFIFNSGDPIYSFTYTNQVLGDRVLQVNGIDTRNRMDNIVEAYYNLSQKFTLNLKFIQSKYSLVSNYFKENDYKIRSYYLEPKFTYNYRTMVRTSVNYGFTQKRNEQGLGGEYMISNKLEYELRYSKATKNTLEAKFSFVKVKYEGENGTTKSYTILEGLQPGYNYIWSTTYTRNISSFLEIGVSYEGRKTGTAKLVNTGRAQLRAVF